MSAVSVEILKKIYNNGVSSQSSVTALENFRLEIKRGEFTCIVGPSGCGKTTLLNLIGGLDKNFEGVISVNGVSPQRSSAVGYMFQSPRLMPWLNVGQNVGLVVDKEPNKDKKIKELLSEMELDKFINAYPKSLSGGMRRRAALARAFILSLIHI